MASFLKELFNDNNSINEKSVVGFASFVCMVIALVVDLVTGYMGKPLVIVNPVTAAPESTTDAVACVPPASSGAEIVTVVFG